AGCAVEFTGTNFWAVKKGDSIDSAGMPDTQDNPWISRYRDFLVFLQKKYGSCFPVAQSILRGPLDILAAVVGDQNMIYAFYDSPGEAVSLMHSYTRIIKDFLHTQQTNTPFYHGGRVIGQYNIWAPGSAARLQQDAQSLLS